LANYDESISVSKNVEPSKSTVFNLTLQIGVVKPAILTGRVFEEIDGQMSVVQNAIVSVYHLGSSKSMDLPVINDKNLKESVFRYLGQEMNPGLWRATVVAPGFEPYVHPSNVVLRPGQKKIQDFVLKKKQQDLERESTATAIVSMQITELTKSPPQVQFVNVNNGLAIKGVTNDKDFDVQSEGDLGWKVMVYYPERNLPAGPYRAEAKSAGYQDHSNGPKQVVADDSTVFNLTLRPNPPPEKPKLGGMWITVLLQYGNENARPISSAKVALFNEDTGQQRRLDRSDAGVFYADNLTPGPWRVAAKIDGMPAVVHRNRVFVVAGRDAECEITMKVQPPRIFTLVGVERGGLKQNEAKPEVHFVNRFAPNGNKISAETEVLDPTKFARLGIKFNDLPEGNLQWFVAQPRQTIVPGQYYAAAKMDGFKNRSSITRSVRNGQITPFLVVLPPVPPTSVLVKVWTEDQEPFGSTATVSLTKDGGKSFVTASWDEAKGGYYSMDLSDGIWLAKAEYQKLKGSKQVLINPGQMTTANIFLLSPPPPRPGQLLVRVLRKSDGRIQTVTDAKVTLTNILTTELISVNLNRNREYRTTVPAGTWLARAKLVDSGKSQMKEIVIESGSSKSCDLTFDVPIEPRPKPRSRVVVKVLLEDPVEGVRTALAGANVVLKNQDIKAFKLNPHPDNAGIYFKDLQNGNGSGTWTYSVRAPGMSEPQISTIMLKEGEPGLIVIKESIVPNKPSSVIEVKVMSEDDNGKRKTISDAELWLRRPGQEEAIKLNPDQNRQGMYVKNLAGSSTTGQWEYAVQFTGLDKPKFDKINLKQGQPGLIVVKTEKKKQNDRPKTGSTSLVVRVWTSRSGERLTKQVIVKLENQTKGKEFRLRNMKRKGSEFEEELDSGNYHVTATIPGRGDEGTADQEIILKENVRNFLDLYLDTHDGELNHDDEKDDEKTDKPDIIEEGNRKEIEEGNRKELSDKIAIRQRTLRKRAEKRMAEIQVEINQIRNGIELEERKLTTFRANTTVEIEKLRPVYKQIQSFLPTGYSERLTIKNEMKQLEIQSRETVVCPVCKGGSGGGGGGGIGGGFGGGGLHLSNQGGQYQCHNCGGSGRVSKYNIALLTQKHNALNVKLKAVENQIIKYETDLKVIDRRVAKLNADLRQANLRFNSGQAQANRRLFQLQAEYDQLQKKWGSDFQSPANSSYGPKKGSPDY
jgi:hypothetical protein